MNFEKKFEKLKHKILLYLPGIIAIKVDFFQYAIIQVFILISSILRYKLLVQLLFLMILII